MKRLAWFIPAFIISSGASAQDVAAWYSPTLRETSNSTTVIDAVGQCASNSPVWLSRFAPLPVNAKKSGEIVRACVRKTTGSDYSVANWILAGSIARGYYIARFSTAPVANDAPFFYLSSDAAERFAPSLRFFDCVLKSAPALTDQLVRSTGHSEGVVLLANAVVLASRSCVAPVGKKYGIQGLKFGLADVLFRRSLPASELVAATSKGAR